MKQTPMPRRRSEMKRGAPMKRSAPLSQGGAGLARGGPMYRSAPMAGPRAPLPERRATPRRTDREHVCMGEAAGKRITRERSGGWCEIGVVCRTPDGGVAPATNASHRKAKGRGGCWCPTNLLDSCGMGNASGCHRWVHEDRDGEASAAGAVVATNHDPAAVSVVLARWGRSFLDVDGGIRPAGFGG